MFTKNHDQIVAVRGIPHKRQVILADVNIPYKFTMDKKTNKLYFCINADEFSDQSFHSAVLDLNVGLAAVILDIRNGFASAIDNANGTVYLGGSDGIYVYNRQTKRVHKPALIDAIDIFDMYYKNELYFVDTATQNLNVYRNNKRYPVQELKDYSIHLFVIDNNGDLYFVSSSRLYFLAKNSKCVRLCDDSNINYRGAAIDANGVPHFISQDGIYAIDRDSKQLIKILSLENGYGLAFDRDNNIVYSDERTVAKLVPQC